MLKQVKHAAFLFWAYLCSRIFAECLRALALEHASPDLPVFDNTVYGSNVVLSFCDFLQNAILTANNGSVVGVSGSVTES